MSTRGPKLTKAEREERLDSIAGLLLTGFNQSEIAEELGISKQQVSYDVKKLKKRWKESQVQRVNEVLNRQLQELHMLKRNAYKSYRTSKGETTVRKVSQRSIPVNGNGSENGVQTLLSQDVTTRKEPGDARFLSVVLNCIKTEMELIGTAAAKRVELSGPEGGPVKHEMMTVEEVIQEMKKTSLEVAAEIEQYNTDSNE